MTDPVVIVGAAMGGLRTAESLRRFGYQGPLTVIGDEPHPPYNRPPLSKDVLAESVTHEAVAFPLRSITDDVHWELGRRIASADLDRRVVVDEAGRSTAYSALVIATGLRPRRLVAGPPTLPGRFALRTLDDAMALRSVLTDGARVLIAGAGFIGCEVAATARQLGCQVTVVGSAPLPMLTPLGPALAEDLMQRHMDRGVQFQMGARVRAVLGADHVRGVELSDGTQLECDVLIEALGSEYNTEWLHGSDLDVSAGVRTDSALRAVRSTGAPWDNVYAVGDVARFPNALYGDIERTIEHWNIPTETAKRAGKVIALHMQQDEDGLATALAEPFAPIPSFWSDQYDIHLLAFGLLGMADDIRLLQGEAGGDCVFGYYLDDAMVGVCGIGFRSVVQGYRQSVGTSVDLLRKTS